MPAICVHSSYAKIVCFLIQGILTVLKEGGKPGPRGAVGRRDLNPVPMGGMRVLSPLRFWPPLLLSKQNLNHFYFTYHGNMTP